MQRLEAALLRTPFQRHVGARRPGDALEVLRTEIDKLEQVAKQLARGLGDYDGVGRGDALKPLRQVRRVADDATLLRFPEPKRSPTTTIPVAMPTLT